MTLAARCLIKLRRAGLGGVLAVPRENVVGPTFPRAVLANVLFLSDLRKTSKLPYNQLEDHSPSVVRSGGRAKGETCQFRLGCSSAKKCSFRAPMPFIGALFDFLGFRRFPPGTKSVPELCQPLADLTVLDELDERSFSNLCRFNGRGATDSVPGHLILEDYRQPRNYASREQ